MHLEAPSSPFAPEAGADLDVARHASRLAAPPHREPAPMDDFDLTGFQEACKGLAEEIGADGVAELLHSYLADTPARLDEMEPMLASGDQASLKRAAHSVKGSSSIFGLAAMERASQRLEHSFAAGESARQAELLAVMRAGFDLARPHVEALAREMESAA
jgi:HPt (histidine-containing phosphotransfer) domain-containing protein